MLDKQPQGRDGSFRERVRKSKAPEKAHLGSGQHPKGRQKGRKRKGCAFLRARTEEKQADTKSKEIQDTSTISHWIYLFSKA